MVEADKGVKLAALDGVFTFVWTIVMSFLGLAAFVIAQYMDYKGDRTPIVWALILVLSMVYGEISLHFGGPAFNPTGPVVFYAVGMSSDTFLTLLMRIPCMALGAAGGISIAAKIMPSSYRHLMGSGPRLKTDLYTGALAEGVLTFVINLVVLYVVFRATKNRFLHTPLIITAAYILVQLGSQYTGAAMNPSDAFAWGYLNKSISSSEQLIVYWLAPLFGAVAAALLYRRIFGSPTLPAAAEEKEKTS